jgi:hypothetical protein
MLVPEPDEADAAYRARIRRMRLLDWLIPLGVIAALIGALALYVAFIAAPTPRVGEACDPEAKTPCDARSICLVDDSGIRGTCVGYCTEEGECPAGYECKMIDLISRYGHETQRTGAMVKVCLQRQRGAR